ncbi:MAG: prolyl oligopeptidase family serine peptidase, partial [Pseudobdellovibrionaceae bacterium]
MKTEFNKTKKENWKEVIPHRADVYMQDADVYEKFIATNEKIKGLNHLYLYDRKTMKKTQIPFSDQSYAAGFSGNVEYKIDTIRYDYSSMRLPPSVFDYTYNTQKTVLKKQREVIGFNPELYKVERVFIPARDGKMVPISILMQKDFVKDGSKPMLIYGYGSYGANLDAGFSSNIFSLVDRGFVFVRAHIRGGSDLGREWYDQGRTDQKMNTFYDFIDATEWLVQNKYASHRKVFAMGGSAGGLLMGAIANLRPDLYRGVVAQVPFVDVITTMLDETIPLTTGEYDEWGNPNEKKYYDYIKRYSPYDQVKAQAYPDFFISTGFHDSQVQYWEPAKWVLKLRDMKTNDAEILFRINMDAGHGGASGRFDILKEIAEEYAFILSRE